MPHTPHVVRWRARGAIALAAALLGTLLGGIAPASAAGRPIYGSGSTSASNQLDSWEYRLRPQGVSVDYYAAGSAWGRTEFRNGTAHFAVTDLPYGLEYPGGSADPAPTQPFGYLPLTAEGVAFPYNLVSYGRRITGLRLSSATLAGIFSRTITRWDDPAVQADNQGLQLPPITIRPVVSSSPAGTSLELTRWLAAEQPAAWQAHCRATGTAPCGPTPLFPTAPGTTALGTNVAIVNQVAQSANNGAIGVTTTAYAVSSGLHTARVLNGTGHYTAPTPAAVTIGLTAARTTADGYTDLSALRTSTDPRAYPLAVVNHLVAPTGETTRFSAEHGRTLGTFAGYGLCRQAEAALLADAPLPPQLITAGLQALTAVPGAGPGPEPSTCTAPVATVIRNAPQPADCDRLGAWICFGDVPVGGPAQLISATVEPGALAVSVAGPTAVTLPEAVLTPDADWFRTTGALTALTVTDTRPGRLPWSLSGRVGDFTGPGGAVIAARQLGWTPSAQSLSGSSPAVPGPAVPPGTGLAEPRSLASGTGPGTDRVGAALDLRIPTGTPAGGYTALLTLTVI
ncbi:substrate-binding domain-containing protein [Kitasatospora sp. NPDC096147]|uniref:substrate-binding domain-containing protein n=1 Tax=Kitasatospora sp. NPDC096147 TaxID=3364093 RepID=UPI00381A1FDD